MKTFYWFFFWYMATCLALYSVFTYLTYPGIDGFALANLAWMCFIVVRSFQRRKPRQGWQFTNFSDYRGPVDCNRCVHLKRESRWLNEHTCLQGHCNITGTEITNTGYPWQCEDFYSANMDD